MLAITGAMNEEIKDIHRIMAVESTDESGDASIYKGRYKNKDLLLAKTGVGKQKAQAALRSLLNNYPITGIISTGFTGALIPELKVGDIVVYSSVICADGLSTDCYDADPRLLSIARECKAIEFRCGLGITGLNLAASVWEKRKLNETTSAEVVDMESYWIARVADEYRIPFVIIRSVSDALVDSLPELSSWRSREVIPYLLAHPAQGLSLYRAVLRARKNIATFAGYLIEEAG